ncbi:hypothetical protein IFVP18_C290221 [Vibrio parahaemolyticus]
MTETNTIVPAKTRTAFSNVITLLLRTLKLRTPSFDVHHYN